VDIFVRRLACDISAQAFSSRKPPRGGRLPVISGVAPCAVDRARPAGFTFL